MMLNLGCIVEGHGEFHAVPVLLRRLQHQWDPSLDLNICRPIRTGRYKLIKPGELERAVELASRQLPLPRAILILIDANTDCPAELGPRLLARAQEARSDVPIGVVLAKCEFEAWFLAAIESLCAHRGLANNLLAVPDPESIRDAKGYLTRQMEGGRTYFERLDQPALTAVFDIALARQRSDSFDKCCREVERLFGIVSQQSPPGKE